MHSAREPYGRIGPGPCHEKDNHIRDDERNHAQGVDCSVSHGSVLSTADVADKVTDRCDAQPVGMSATTNTSEEQCGRT